MKIVWDATGEKRYETGTDRGVLYPMENAGTYSTGVPWNGLTAVTESPDGAEATDLWADNIKYASFRSAEEFGGTIEAYTYPDEFGICDGTASPVEGVSLNLQGRKPFGFSYRTVYGSDTNPDGYKIHIVYGATASPSEKAYETVNDSPDAITFSWEFDTTPVNVTGHKPTSLITIDSTTVSAAALQAIEDILYGTAEEEPRLPLPDEVISTIRTADA